MFLRPGIHHYGRLSKHHLIEVFFGACTHKGTTNLQGVACRFPQTPPRPILTAASAVASRCRLSCTGHPSWACCRVHASIASRARPTACARPCRSPLQTGNVDVGQIVSCHRVITGGQIQLKLPLCRFSLPSSQWEIKGKVNQASTNLLLTHTERRRSRERRCECAHRVHALWRHARGRAQVGKVKQPQRLKLQELTTGTWAVHRDTFGARVCDGPRGRGSRAPCNS